jgi:hypothetical protein
MLTRVLRTVKLNTIDRRSQVSEWTGEPGFA